MSNSQDGSYVEMASDDLLALCVHRLRVLNHTWIRREQAYAQRYKESWEYKLRSFFGCAPRTDLACAQRWSHLHFGALVEWSEYGDQRIADRLIKMALKQTSVFVSRADLERIDL